MRRIENGGDASLCASEAPKVSVIIPAYDLESYIVECLQSIADQSLTAFEAIVVDDGSTDATADVVERFCEQDARFRLVRLPHENAGVARNAGSALAEGEYLLFFDGDDVMAPYMLEAMVERADSTRADIVVCRARSFAEEPRRILDEDFGPYGIELETVYSPDDLGEELFETCVGWPWDKLFRRTFVEEAEVSFQSLTSTNDAFFVFVSMASAHRIAFVDEFLVLHRRREGSIEQRRSASPHNAFLAYEAIVARMRTMPQWERYLRKAACNWALTHLRWNYRTLSDGSRREAFEDYRRVLASLASEPDSFFKHREDVWVREALSVDADAHEILIADRTIDMRYGEEDMEKLRSRLAEEHRRIEEMQELIEVERERSEKRIADLCEKVDWLEGSTSYKVGLAVTALPRRLKDVLRSDEDGKV